MGLRTPTINAPASGIEASQQLAQREMRAQRSRISFMLHSITRKIVDYPACPQSGMSLEEFRQKPTGSTRFARTTPIRVANMQDGVGIVFTTEDFLEDRLHRLTLPKSHEPQYARWAINVDSQKIPSDTIEAVGLEQLLASPDLLSSLNFCMGALAVEASTGWTHALK